MHIFWSLRPVNMLVNSGEAWSVGMQSPVVQAGGGSVPLLQIGSTQNVSSAILLHFRAFHPRG